MTNNKMMARRSAREAGRSALVRLSRGLYPAWFPPNLKSNFGILKWVNPAITEKGLPTLTKDMIVP
jgi:hypothetical protein